MAAPTPPPAGPETFNLDELRRDAVRRAIAATDGHYGRAVTVEAMRKRVSAAPKTLPDAGHEPPVP